MHTYKRVVDREWQVAGRGVAGWRGRGGVWRAGKAEEWRRLLLYYLSRKGISRRRESAERDLPMLSTTYNTTTYLYSNRDVQRWKGGVEEKYSPARTFYQSLKTYL